MPGAAPAMLPRGCTFAPNDHAILARHWFPIAALTQVGAWPLAVTLLDVPLVVYRAGTTLRVARDLCPHRGLPLSLGRVEGEELVCAYHGLRYGPDGQCRKIPAQPDVRPPARFKVTMFPAVERYGLVWTCLDPQDGEPALPPLREWEDPAYQPILPPFVDIAASAGRQLEGFVDVAHFAWVHHETFADPDNPVVPLYAKIFAEDQAIVERQCPEDLPLELDTEVHFAADRTSVEYRRLLKNMGLSFAQTA